MDNTPTMYISYTGDNRLWCWDSPDDLDLYFHPTLAVLAIDKIAVAYAHLGWMYEDQS